VVLAVFVVLSTNIYINNFSCVLIGKGACVCVCVSVREGGWEPLETKPGIRPPTSSYLPNINFKIMLEMFDVTQMLQSYKKD
jgi:hypothetical protein